MAADGKTFTVSMDVSSAGMGDVHVYRTSGDSFATWTKMEVTMRDGYATFHTSEGGVYVARAHTNVGAIVGATIGVLLLVGLIVAATVLYVRKHPNTCAGISRSLSAKV